MKKFGLIICVLLTLLCWPKITSAYQISAVAGTAVSADYVVGQGKNELSLSPGSEKIQDIYILNRSGQDLNFVVSVEDFSSVNQAQEAINFSNNQSSLYPAKTWLFPEISKFTLKHGEKMTLPVLIKLGSQVSPGGLYGAVMISNQPAGAVAGSQVKPTASLASLFFVRVNGTINESGAMESFTSSKKLYQQGPVQLIFSFNNSGNIYLNPHGAIAVTDLWGKTIYAKQILPYFVLPGATRQLKEEWQASGNWGIYRITLNLSRGYGTAIDRQAVTVLILPWWGLVVTIVLSAILVGLVIWLVMKFKRR